MHGSDGKKPTQGPPDRDTRKPSPQAHLSLSLSWGNQLATLKSQSFTERPQSLPFSKPSWRRAWGHIHLKLVPPLCSPDCFPLSVKRVSDLNPLCLFLLYILTRL